MSGREGAGTRVARPSKAARGPACCCSAFLQSCWDESNGKPGCKHYSGKTLLSPLSALALRCLQCRGRSPAAMT